MKSLLLSLAACVQFVAAACTASGSTGVAMQFVDVRDEDVPNEAFGIGLFGLGDEDSTVSWFADLHVTVWGDVRGQHLSDPPITAETDPITGHQVRSGALHLGTCLRATDWLYFYGGGGAGYAREYVERQNPAVTSDPSGYYYYGEGETFGGSVSVGALLQPAPGVLVGLGYESWFEGVVISLGFAF